MGIEIKFSDAISMISLTVSIAAIIYGYINGRKIKIQTERLN